MGYHIDYLGVGGGRGRRPPVRTVPIWPKGGAQRRRRRISPTPPDLGERETPQEENQGEEDELDTTRSVLSGTG